MKKLIFSRISLGSDHAGFEMKEKILGYLKTKEGLEIRDCGCYSNSSVDYPDIAHSVCETIQNEESDGGILICGNGIGISIAANKHQGIICGLILDETTSIVMRKCQNVNVIAFGGRTTDFEKAKKYVDNFLSTPFESGGRHERRVKKLKKMYMKKE